MNLVTALMKLKEALDSNTAEQKRTQETLTKSNGLLDASVTEQARANELLQGLTEALDPKVTGLDVELGVPKES